MINEHFTGQSPGQSTHSHSPFSFQFAVTLLAASSMPFAHEEHRIDGGAGKSLRPSSSPIWKSFAIANWNEQPPTPFRNRSFARCISSLSSLICASIAHNFSPLLWLRQYDAEAKLFISFTMKLLCTEFTEQRLEMCALLCGIHGSWQPSTGRMLWMQNTIVFDRPSQAKNA